MLKQIKISMMKSSRQQESDSDEEESSSSDDDFDPVFQIGHIKIHYQKKDLIKETIARFSQSLLDLSISPTSIFFLGSTKF
jgi:hypothetical protein